MTVHELLAQGHRTMTRGPWPQGRIMTINERGFSYPCDLGVTAQDMASDDWVVVRESTEDNKRITNIYKRGFYK